MLVPKRPWYFWPWVYAVGTFWFVSVIGLVALWAVILL